MKERKEDPIAGKREKKAPDYTAGILRRPVSVRQYSALSAQQLPTWWQNSWPVQLFVQYMYAWFQQV